MNDVCFSLPTVIDRGGIQKVIKLKLADEERIGLINSANVLKNMIKQLGLE